MANNNQEKCKPKTLKPEDIVAMKNLSEAVISPDGKWVVFVRCKNGQLMRPDSELWIVPLEGGTARPLRSNRSPMNSWHSFSPNGRWLVFSSKANTPYTQMFLTHLDENGNAMISGQLEIDAVASIDQYGNLSTNINGEIDGAFEWNFFPAKKLVKLGKKVEILDGDVVRQSLTKDLGFTEADRKMNLERVTFVAKLLILQH